MKINWRRKLTSRSLWIAVASFVSMLIVFLGGTDAVATEVSALIIAGATVIAYIIGEGLADTGSHEDGGDSAEGASLTEEDYVDEFRDEDDFFEERDVSRRNEGSEDGKRIEKEEDEDDPL